MNKLNYSVMRVKSLAMALKALEPFVRNGQALQIWKKPVVELGNMLPRETLANWLLCAVANATRDGKYTFCSAPRDIGGDGIICDVTTGETWPTEHVMVPERPGQACNAEELILQKVEMKRSKGGAGYANGKTLVVFLNAGAGIWYPNSVARRLPDPLLFDTVWVAGPQRIENGEYVYGVTNLDLSEGDVPVFEVRIGKEFDDWTVTQLAGGDGREHSQVQTR
jgi:hypothetical protein